MKTKTPDHLAGMKTIRFFVALIVVTGGLAMYFMMDPESFVATENGLKFLWSLLWEHIR